ncbi:MAG: substrate-binding domain-containing protein, partial [Photobacterium halotolerans]
LQMRQAEPLLFHSHGEFTIESGYSQMKQLLETFTQTDGVFCATDRIAIGAINALKDAGKTAGKDVKVLGVGNDELSSVCSPSLSTFNYAFDKAGESSARVLLELIEGKPQVMSKVVLTFQNIDRETC